MRVEEARQAVAKAENELDKALKEYSNTLEANDEVTSVAFLLYQKFVSMEEGWEGPVTWEDWEELTIESERNEWRKLAAEILSIIKEGHEN